MRLAIKLGAWSLVIFSLTIAMVFAQQFGLMPADPFFGLSTVIGLVQCVSLIFCSSCWLFQFCLAFGGNASSPNLSASPIMRSSGTVAIAPAP